MLLNDLTSFQSFSSLLPVISKNSEKKDFIRMLKNYSKPKLFLAGSDEVLFTIENLSQDAKDIGADFKVIKSAGHFVTFDQPEAVAKQIEDFISTAIRK